MGLRTFQLKVLLLGFFSRAFCTSSSVTVSPSPSIMEVSSQVNATTSAPGGNDSQTPATLSQVIKTTTANPGVNVTPDLRGTNSMAKSSQIDTTATAQVGGRSPSSNSISGSGSRSSPISGSGSISPSVSGSVIMSSSVSGGSLSPDQYLQTLSPKQRAVIKNFENKRKDLVNELEIKSEVKPKETSKADTKYLSSLNNLIEELQKAGREFSELDGNINYVVKTKSNALQSKKFDCLKDRLSMFPEVVDLKAISATANSMALPLECPSEVIKESRRRRREVVLSIEMSIDKLPAMHDIDEEPTQYTHMYRYLRMRRDAEANQNKSDVCLQKSDIHCFDERLNVTFRIWSEEWKSSYANKNSQDFKTLTNDIKEKMENSVSTHKSSLIVSFHSFELRPGSVIVCFYADTLKTMASNLTTYLKGVSSFGTYKLNQTSSIVKNVTVVHGGWASFTEWPSTSPNYTYCGNDFRVNRTRTCTNPKPENGGKDCEGPKQEFKSCEFGGKLTVGSGGIISSPYWPSHEYPSNAEGMWILEVPFNHTVELLIDQFHLEKDKKCFYDYIQIFDGNTTNAPLLLPRTCGTAAVNKTIRSTGTSMLVKFRSDRTVTFKGFNATWKMKMKPRTPPKPVRYKEQNVLVTNVISCPTYNESLVPLGKATTCLTKSPSSDCYFEMPAYLITCIIGIKTNRSDLSYEDINMTFKHIMHKDLFPSYYLMKKTCVTWNTSYTSSAWSRKGCTVKSTNISHTVCECDHTGVFAVLVTDKVVHKKFSLLANTYAGIGVSFFIVIIAILHIVWKVDVHGGEAMRINMCVAIIFMMMTFLIGANVKAEKHLCSFLAFLEYFSVVAQFFWLMLHGLRIHGKIKEIFASGLNIEIVYVGFGWGLPLLLSLIAIGIQMDIKNPNEVCWTAIAGGSMWGYGAPLLIVIMLNILVLCAVVFPSEERKTKYLYYPMMYRMLKDATLLALFGFTCIMAYLTVEIQTFMAQYFLTISVVLQGVAMIVFGREGRKDYVRRDIGKMEHDNISENTNEVSFGKFEDEPSSNRSSRNSNKDQNPSSPERKGMKLKSPKFQETDLDA